MTTPEGKIVEHLARRCKELGLFTRALEWRGVNGAPDRIVIGAEVVAFFECKAPGGAALFPKNAHERAQEREHKRMRAAGALVFVVDSKEEIDTILGELYGG